MVGEGFCRAAEGEELGDEFNAKGKPIPRADIEQDKIVDLPGLFGDGLPQHVGGESCSVGSRVGVEIGVFF